MLTIKVQFDMARLQRQLQEQAKQVQFAMAKALTNTAKDVRQELMDELPKAFDRPVPFTLRGIGYTPASKTSLTATVFIRETQAKYLDLQVKGGTEYPKHRALLKPAAVPLNQYGNLPRNKVKQLLARKNTFSGRVRGIGGIWQRVGVRNVKLLVAYVPSQEVKARLDFYGIGKRVVARRFEPNFEAALARAIATAR